MSVPPTGADLVDIPPLGEHDDYWALADDVRRTTELVEALRVARSAPDEDRSSWRHRLRARGRAPAGEDMGDLLPPTCLAGRELAFSVWPPDGKLGGMALPALVRFRCGMSILAELGAVPLGDQIVRDTLEMVQRLSGHTQPELIGMIDQQISSRHPEAAAVRQRWTELGWPGDWTWPLALRIAGVVKPFRVPEEPVTDTELHEGLRMAVLDQSGWAADHVRQAEFARKAPEPMRLGHLQERSVALVRRWDPVVQRLHAVPDLPLLTVLALRNEAAALSHADRLDTGGIASAGRAMSAVIRDELSCRLTPGQLGLVEHVVAGPQPARMVRAYSRPVFWQSPTLTRLRERQVGADVSGSPDRVRPRTVQSPEGFRTTGHASR